MNFVKSLSKFSVKSFLAKPLSDHLSDLTTHDNRASANVSPCNSARALH